MISVKSILTLAQGGLLDEIKTLYTLSANAADGSSTTIDYSSGVYQSIGGSFVPGFGLRLIHPGFKEFHDYYSSPSDAAFSTGVESMKRATQKYAKYQTKWIRHKFLPAARAAPDTHLYVLDTTGT